ncbi:hypothetical protein NQZ68_029314 [Dissostichus eleginoides]|nr:hypothetical protein NQZ68_029314 [Dissostichus eleginoides]
MGALLSCSLHIPCSSSSAPEPPASDPLPDSHSRSRSDALAPATTLHLVLVGESRRSSGAFKGSLRQSASDNRKATKGRQAEQAWMSSF